MARRGDRRASSLVYASTSGVGRQPTVAIGRAPRRLSIAQ